MAGKSIRWPHLVASFANGVRKDEAAVRAAIISAWSDGQTEGQITKLKLIKLNRSVLAALRGLHG